MAGKVPGGRWAGGEKEPVSVKRQMAVLRRLWKYLYKFKWLLMLALFMTVSSNLLALVGPKLSGYAMDAIAPGKGGVDFKTVGFYCAWMIVFYVASAALSYILSRIMIRLGKSVAKDMRRDVFNHLLEMPVRYFDGHQIGDIVNRISYDIDTINASLSTDFVQILASLITVIGSLVMMFSIAPVLVSVFAVTVPLSLLFTRYMSRWIRPKFRRRSAMLGELNGYTEEILTGQKTVKIYGRENVMSERFAEKNEQAVGAYFDAEYYGAMIGPMVMFVNNLSLSLVSVFGALLYMAKRIELGDISAFVLYSRKFSGPINELANIISELQSATTAAERVFRLLDEPAEVADVVGATGLMDVKGEVKLQNVTFGYLPERTILHDLSFTAKPGSLTAIVGPTGAGKTTVINLLMRFYDVNSGEISVDGKEIRSLQRDSLRKAYAMVLQDTWLFGGTIRENIAYGNDNATEEQIIEAAKAAYIHPFIRRLSDGYDTVLTDDGINLSKGQKQLLTIARAMLSDAPMLILDEATSNVDSRTEQLIQRAMRRLMEHKTCFVIAHRLSTIQHADTILVVRDGDIVEQGTHQELLSADGFYASLYNAQFE